MNSYLAVGLGGAIGAILRLVVSEWVGNPQGTLLVNALGSLLLGICMAALASEMISKEMTLLLGTGILGGFTTMSTFSVELQMVRLRVMAFFAGGKQIHLHE